MCVDPTQAQVRRPKHAWLTQLKQFGLLACKMRQLNGQTPGRRRADKPVSEASKSSALSATTAVPCSTQRQQQRRTATLGSDLTQQSLKHSTAIPRICSELSQVFPRPGRDRSPSLMDMDGSRLNVHDAQSLQHHRHTVAVSPKSSSPTRSPRGRMPLRVEPRRASSSTPDLRSYRASALAGLPDEYCRTVWLGGAPTSRLQRDCLMLGSEPPKLVRKRPPPLKLNGNITGK